MNPQTDAALAFASHSLGAYAIAQWSGFRIANHHRRIINALQRVESGQCKRLMIFMPPRHGKSMLVSEYFPAWYLGRRPDHYIISATYGQELASDWGRKVRNQLRDGLHQTIFQGCRIRDDSQAADRLNTEQGGAYFAVGVGGAITGRGAHVLLIDDPIRNREDADSEVYRRKLREWYQAVAYTRLMPGGAIVLLQTRWNENDLPGWLIDEHAHEGWEIISMPALDNDGNALWPEAYDTEALDKIRLAVGPRDWQALYMQSPTAEEGNYFKREWMTWYEERPPNLSIYGASDYAVTADGGDYTEHGVFGVDPAGDVYVLDWWSGQTASDIWIRIQIDMMQQHKPLMWFGESGVIRRAVEPYLTSEMAARREYCRIEWLASTTDKGARASPLQALVASGRFKIPAKKAWSSSILEQMLAFPTGKYDDKVDTCGLFARAYPNTANVHQYKAHRKAARNWRTA